MVANVTKTNLSKIFLPTKYDNIDEELIKGIVENTSYWRYVEKSLLSKQNTEALCITLKTEQEMQRGLGSIFSDLK